MNRQQRAKIAEHTLTIIEDGGYINPTGEKIELDDQIEYAVDNTKLYKPEDLAKLEQDLKEINA